MRAMIGLVFMAIGGLLLWYAFSASGDQILASILGGGLFGSGFVQVLLWDD